MMKKTGLIFVFILLFLFTRVNCQNIDSLKNALKKAKHDTDRVRTYLFWGEQIYLSEPDSALILWDKVIAISKMTLPKLNKNSKEYLSFKNALGCSLNNKGSVTELKGDPSRALELYLESLENQKEINNQKEIALCLNNIAGVYLTRGDIAKALEYYENSLTIQITYNYTEGAAIAQNNIGNIYLNQGDFVKARLYFSKSLKNSERIGDKRLISSLLVNMGSVDEYTGNIKNALDSYFKSLKIREEISDAKGIAGALKCIGNLYVSQGNLTDAHKYFNRSLKLREKLGDKAGIGISFNQIGMIYYMEKRYDEALVYLIKSLNISNELNDKMGQAVSMGNMGSIYKMKAITQNSNKIVIHKLYDSALVYFEQSLKIRRELEDNEGSAFCLLNIGSIFFKKKEYFKAIEFGQSSLKLYNSLRMPDGVKNSASLLSEIYKTTGKFKESMEHYELFIKMRDSINNIETQKATIKKQTQYEYEKQKVIEDEKHTSELKVQEEKALADKKRQNIIIGSVSVVLLLMAIFSVLLYNRFKTTQKQKQIIEVKEKETQQQKHIIEEKQKEIIDSINYAKRIQYSLLAHADFLKANLPNNFVYFNPKDIVSGDFYWATKKDDKFYLAVCDSTGHGVPGAFMSLLNIGFLAEAINEKGIEKPNEVFEFVRQRLTNTISKEGQKDGFDGILMCFDQKNKSITYAAANNAPVIVQNGLLQTLEADRMPVGVGERKEDFKLYSIDSNPGDTIYLYTDGYADQFGGPRGKKFKYKPLNDLILANHNNPLEEQKNVLRSAFDSWRGDLEQIDDVCVIGIRV